LQPVEDDSKRQAQKCSSKGDQYTFGEEDVPHLIVVSTHRFEHRDVLLLVQRQHHEAEKNINGPDNEQQRQRKKGYKFFHSEQLVKILVLFFVVQHVEALADLVLNRFLDAEDVRAVSRLYLERRSFLSVAQQLLCKPEGYND